MGHEPAVVRQTSSIQATQNLTVLMPDRANISLCRCVQPLSDLSFEVVEGPELMVSWMNSTSRFWTTPWALSTNGTVLNSGMTNFTLHNPNNASVPFRLDRGAVLVRIGVMIGTASRWLLVDSSSFTLTPPNAPLATMWLTYEAGTVVLHLSSYQ